VRVVQEIINIIWNSILTIRVWDVLDMAIIAFLIYRLVSFVRRTGSASVVKGIVFLVAIMGLSSLLQLSVVSYLLREAFQIGILALVVLFQPELRRILEHFGSSRFLRAFGPRMDTEALDTAIKQTVMACADMSESCTGALIVFERTISLDTYIKTGSLIDAEPNAELIKNIFFPKTPLHDGAVIVRNGRIAGAACMLPLSNNLNLSRDLGMRHRAGVGMSERSDAVIIIVSEETGSISVAVDGMLKRHLTLETAEVLLRNELLPRERTGKSRITRKEKTGSKNPGDRT